jgi:hypothetical protein
MDDGGSVSIIQRDILDRVQRIHGVRSPVGPPSAGSTDAVAGSSRSSLRWGWKCKRTSPSIMPFQAPLHATHEGHLHHICAPARTVPAYKCTVYAVGEWFVTCLFLEGLW